MDSAAADGASKACAYVVHKRLALTMDRKDRWHLHSKALGTVETSETLCSPKQISAWVPKTPPRQGQTQLGSSVLDYQRAFPFHGVPHLW